MEISELIKKMRARVERARRLAKYINDPRTTEALLLMAEEGEGRYSKARRRGSAPRALTNIANAKDDSKPIAPGSIMSAIAFEWGGIGDFDYTSAKLAGVLKVVGA
jgi:hypothetical protein